MGRPRRRGFGLRRRWRLGCRLRGGGVKKRNVVVEVSHGLTVGRRRLRFEVRHDPFARRRPW